MTTKDNIVLDYKVQILIGDQVFFAPSCEFFMDEHGLQWVKFKPRNGYDHQRGKEHILRTENVIIVVDSLSEAGRSILDKAVESGEGG